MNIEDKLVCAIQAAARSLYGADVAAESIQLQKTKKEF